MRILYECEKVAVLQEDENFIVHILDDYRMVKEIIVKRNKLLSTLKKEIPSKDTKKKSIFGKKNKRCMCKCCELDNIEKILKLV